MRQSWILSVTANTTKQRERRVPCRQNRRLSAVLRAPRSLHRFLVISSTRSTIILNPHRLHPMYPSSRESTMSTWANMWTLIRPYPLRRLVARVRNELVKKSVSPFNFTTIARLWVPRRRKQHVRQRMRAHGSGTNMQTYRSPFRNVCIISHTILTFPFQERSSVEH